MKLTLQGVPAGFGVTLQELLWLFIPEGSFQEAEQEPRDSERPGKCVFEWNGGSLRC